MKKVSIIVVALLCAVIGVVAWDYVNYTPVISCMDNDGGLVAEYNGEVSGYKWMLGGNYNASDVNITDEIIPYSKTDYCMNNSMILHEFTCANLDEFQPESGQGYYEYTLNCSTMDYQTNITDDNGTYPVQVIYGCPTSENRCAVMEIINI
jgi:hypothetical protein